MSISEQFVNKDFIEKQLKYSEIYHYLDRYKCRKLLPVPESKRNETVKLNKTIWIYWKQGIENAPRLVQRCHESVCRNKPMDFNVITLSDQNLDEYIQLADCIWEKHEEGYITTTHLSDVIRLELLCTYGGCWIDATVYCSDSIPRYMLSGEMFLFRLAAPESEPILKMSSWWLCAEKNNRIIQMTRQMLLKYWKNETEIRNYFLLHIMMSKIIDEDSDCKAIYIDVPYFNSGNAHALQDKLGMEYSQNGWEIIRETSHVHKLTCKKRFLQGDIYSYYMALMDGKLS